VPSGLRIRTRRTRRRSSREKPAPPHLAAHLSGTLYLVALTEAELEWLMVPEAPALPTLADLLPPRPSWMAAGACRDRPDVTWFPDRGKSTAPAKAICAGCPVRVECLSFAQHEGIDHGTWGGLSPRERRKTWAAHVAG
jgi:WhiB family redox-sensing transcriptional regulator